MNMSFNITKINKLNKQMLPRQFHAPKLLNLNQQLMKGPSVRSPKVTSLSPENAQNTNLLFNIRQNTLAGKPKFQPGLLARTQDMKGAKDKIMKELLDDSILEGTSMMMQMEKRKDGVPHRLCGVSRGGKQRNKYIRA